MFKTSRLFLANKESAAHVVVNQGGTSSGKTYAILQVLFALACESPKQVITIAGQDIPNLKAGALRDAVNIYNESDDLKKLVKAYNKSERIFEFHNGSIIEFKSYDNAQDAKSGKRNYLFVNEANGILYEIYTELALRTNKQIFIDYNPNSRFWVHEKLLNTPGVELLISDHRHNPFLGDETREKIESLKNEDEELWRVYARGLTGKIEGLVYRNWYECESIPADAKFIGIGLDFGFTNDPTAALEVYLQNGELWINELIYETGMTNPDIYEALKDMRGREVIADSAEPKSVEELRRLGLRISPAMKGSDSLRAGIDILKRYRLNITKRSKNLKKELNAYKWKKDRQTGEPLNEPVDTFNHGLDGLRYVALNKLKTGTSFHKPKTSF